MSQPELRKTYTFTYTRALFSKVLFRSHSLNIRYFLSHHPDSNILRRHILNLKHKILAGRPDVERKVLLQRATHQGEVLWYGYTLYRKSSGLTTIPVVERQVERFSVGIL